MKYQCLHCGKTKETNQKHQQFCPEPNCQKERKRRNSSARKARVGVITPCLPAKEKPIVLPTVLPTNVQMTVELSGPLNKIEAALKSLQGFSINYALAKELPKQNLPDNSEELNQLKQDYEELRKRYVTLKGAYQFDREIGRA